MLQRAKMAGNMLALFALIFSVFCVFPSLSERASFRQQESYMGDVGTRGKEVELQFKGNECLRKVLEEIVSSCKDGQQIADQRQRNLFAFNIMNCYANFTFKEAFPCSSEDVSACIDLFVASHKGEEEVQEMYMHLERLIQVDNLCVAVQQDQWQAEMDHLVDGLLQSSATAVDKLEETLQREEQLSQQQRKAEKNQQRILDTGKKAQETLDSSHQEMNESFSSVFAFLQEQQQIITKMFEEFNLVTDSLSFLLSIFQGKVTFLHSLLFFVLASTLSYAATGYKYTHQARPWLYVVCTSNFLLEAAAVLYQQVWASAGGSFLQQRYYALLVGVTVLVIVGVKQVWRGSPQSSHQLLLLSNKLEDIGKKVSPVHRAREGPHISPVVLVNESSAMNVDWGSEETDYAHQVDDSATAATVGGMEMALSQGIVIHQESHVSVVAEEEWSNVGFGISKASERDEREKGEEEVRGEKESRELKRTGERPSKKSRAVQEKGAPKWEELQGTEPMTPGHRYNLRRRTLVATPLH